MVRKFGSIRTMSPKATNIQTQGKQSVTLGTVKSEIRSIKESNNFAEICLSPLATDSGDDGYPGLRSFHSLHPRLSKFVDFGDGIKLVTVGNAFAEPF